MLLINEVVMYNIIFADIHLRKRKDPFFTAKQRARVFFGKKYFYHFRLQILL